MLPADAHLILFMDVISHIHNLPFPSSLVPTTTCRPLLEPIALPPSSLLLFVDSEMRGHSTSGNLSAPIIAEHGDDTGKDVDEYSGVPRTRYALFHYTSRSCSCLCRPYRRRQCSSDLIRPELPLRGKIRPFVVPEMVGLKLLWGAAFTRGTRRPEQSAKSRYRWE